MLELNRVAESNFSALCKNTYPGRGLIIGKDDTGKRMIQIYWIMGRSENSRNRVLCANEVEGRIFTDVIDSSKVKDSTLIIYSAMLEYHSTGEHIFAVSNGDQTGELIAGARRGEHAISILNKRQFEPDAPHFTPRISGGCIIGRGKPDVMLSILRKSIWDNTCDRSYYRYENIAPGFGFCLTTYSGDGNPLPSFRGDPLLMPLQGSIDAIAGTYWQTLSEANRVSLAMKSIDIATGKSNLHIINKFNKL